MNRVKILNGPKEATPYHGQMGTLESSLEDYKKDAKGIGSSKIRFGFNSVRMIPNRFVWLLETKREK